MSRDETESVATGGQHPLEYIFHPRSIAVVGVSEDPDKFGNAFLRSLIDFGFEGPLYPVHPRAGEIMGLKVYPSVRDIPGPVDHVISSIDASHTPQLTRDCVAKGVRVLHFFTAGFSETGDPDRIALERQVVRIAQEGGVRIIGPNCMGLFCPESRLTFSPALPTKGGVVGLISQSGGNAQELLWQGEVWGVHYSKAISYGNGSDLREVDFLEYLAADTNTRVIAAYLEGIIDGPRFVEAITQAARSKPLIVIKGGQSDAGTRAVASHTGSLAGSDDIWNGLLHQVGAVRVHGLEEMLDTLSAFVHLRPPQGRNVAIIGTGGGASVLAADECEKAGLRVPPMPESIKETLWQFTPLAGTSVNNPLDSIIPGSIDEFRRTIETVASSPEIHSIIAHVGVEWCLNKPNGESVLADTVSAILQAGASIGKPLAVALRTSGRPETWPLVFRQMQNCTQAGHPVYPSIGRAAHALGRLFEYHRHRQDKS